jgi:hypothetical protein
MNLLTAHIEGIALWTPTLPNWETAKAAFRDKACGEVRNEDVGIQITTHTAAETSPRRPSPELLHAIERRRAPDTVVLALEVAAKAVAQSKRRADELLSVFTSAHGDLSITDQMCRVLATTPTLISPTKFHHSVHNAASGYWTMTTHCMQASTAVSGFDCSFAAGLLEALTFCATENSAVLLVGYDVAACGPLVSANSSRGLLATALVLSPQRSEKRIATINACLVSATPLQPIKRESLRSKAAQALTSNAMADALPLLEALACCDDRVFLMPLSESLALQISSG